MILKKLISKGRKGIATLGLLGMLGSVGCVGTLNEGKEQLIGGQRDEHGCLIPAGYSWNKTLNTCLREWKLNEIQRDAVKIATDFLGYHKGLTVSEVLIARRPDCFVVKFDLYQTKFDVIIEDSEVIGNKCKPEDREVDTCRTVYDPVCGMPINKTFNNSYFACLDTAVIYYLKGECPCTKK